MHAPPRSRFFGTLPERGLWTAVGLTRGQFVGILALSVTLFVFVDGPLWGHVHDRHLRRIVISYGVIVPATVLAMHRNGGIRALTVIGASAVIALVKLLLTAALLVAFALGR